MAKGFDLRDILTIASIHPFYSDVVYPPMSGDMPGLLVKDQESAKELELSSFSLTWKDSL